MSVTVNETVQSVTVSETTQNITVQVARSAESSANSFSTINCPNGTDPVADSSADTLNLTSTGGTVTITGNSLTDTINFEASAGASTLQEAYDGGTNITVNDTANEGVTLTDSATNSNRDNILEIKNTGASVVHAFTRLGQTINGLLSIINQVAGSVALTLKAAASQTAAVLSITDSSDTEVFSVNDAGTVSGAIYKYSNQLQDANNANTAIVSGNSGQWIIMKANNANTGIWTFDGLSMQGGKDIFMGATCQFYADINDSASLPAYAFNGDPNTGMLHVAADTLGFTTGGTTRLQISKTAITNSLPVGLPQYATGSLPTASSFEGHIVYDSTTNEVKFSDGSTWTAL